VNHHANWNIDEQWVYTFTDTLLEKMETFFMPPFSCVMSGKALFECGRIMRVMGTWIDGITLTDRES
jgi:putative effector of murein hydrolase LrgA (UPF0299 family)